MKAGKLRHRVIIQQPTQSQSTANGEVTNTWSTYLTRWARVVPLSGRELFNAQQVQPDITHRVEMRRFTDSVTPAMRILWGTRVFQIHAVTEVDERRIETHLLCSEPK